MRPWLHLLLPLLLVLVAPRIALGQSEVPAFPPLPGRPPFALPERPKEVPAPAGGLRDALSELDRRSGLSWGGALVERARQVAQSETARGSARIEVDVTASGKVRAARVISTTRDPVEWRRVVDALRANEIRGLRLPSDAQGGWMMFTIDSEWLFPTGTPSARPALEPGPTLAFDITSIGAIPVKTVSARILSTAWY